MNGIDIAALKQWADERGIDTDTAEAFFNITDGDDAAATLFQDVADYNIDALIGLYGEWCSEQKLPQLSADELLYEDINDAQSFWLRNFSIAWGHAAKLEHQKWQAAKRNGG